MSKSVLIKQTWGFLSSLPVGSIIALHRDLLGEDGYKPKLPPGWGLWDGQPLAESWIKIRNISDEVELWLVK
ncbi:hypothetical protein KA005_24875 [bacterium]|nr:hypothetical protein [bacterium]